MNSYFDSSEFQEILRSYEEQLSKGESPYFDADDFADIADNYLTSDRPDEALDAVNRGLAIHNDDDVLLSTKSAIFIFQHKYKEARQIIEENELEGNDVLYQKAQLTYALDFNTEKAERRFRKWMKVELENCEEIDKPYVDRDSYLHVISSFIELHDNAIDNEKDLALIRRWITEYMDRFSPLGKYDSDVSVTDICRNNHLADLLVRGLSQVLDEQPYLRNGWSTLALGYFTVENYEQSIEATDFALAINPHDKEAMLTRAYCHNYLNQREDACNYFEQYWQEDDIDLVQGIPYAECLLALNRKEEAASYILIGEDALEKERAADGLGDHSMYMRYTQATLDAIDVYQTLEQYEDCRRCLNRLLELEPSNCDYHFMMANILLASDQLSDAMTHYTNAIMNCQDQVKMVIEISMVLIVNNYDAMALELLEHTRGIVNKLPDLSPNAKNLPAVLALTYLKVGDPMNFLDNLKVAIETTPDLVRHVFDGYFPKEIEMDDYYAYAQKLVEDYLNEDNSTD